MKKKEGCEECTWCYGEEYCDLHMTRCAVCGEWLVTGEMWNYDGEKLCVGCFGEKAFGIRAKRIVV